MVALFCLFLALFASPFKSKSRLEAENAALRHQLIILRRKVRGRVRLMNDDRLFFIQLYRWFPSVLKAITIVRPETLVRWHRAGFRRYWRCKSRSLGGRPQIDADANRPPRDGAPSCVTMRRTPPPWTCSLPRPLASTCSMSSSSFDWSAETLSGSTSHHIRPRNGLHVRSQRHSLGLKPRAT